ncbi:MAG: TIGR04211 family SH3 domain-containing protein [bacterium]
MPRYRFLLLLTAAAFMSIVFLSQSNAAAKTMYVSAIHMINMRSEPEMSSRIVARARSGEPITVVSQKGGWYYIRTPQGEEGWVAQSLLTNKKPLAEQLEILTIEADKQARLIAQLSQENKSLKKYVRLFELTEGELKQIRNKNYRLKNRQDQMWAAFGAGILLFGWFIGLITRGFSWKKKSGYRYMID